MKKELITLSQIETEELGSRFAEILKPGDVIAMYGDLGAGKTAFVRGVMKGLGFEGNVTSPTFAIVNEYKGGRLNVAHFDVYRIGSEEELYGTGFYDYLDGKSVAFIEWSENIPFAVNEDCIKLSILKADDEKRVITVESSEEIKL